jgi:hypothetical protein
MERTEVLGALPQAQCVFVLSIFVARTRVAELVGEVLFQQHIKGL